MNAVPAKVAGVERVVMAVPAPGGEINPLVLVAADLAGVSRDLPGRRRAGDRRARLWHRDDPAGRQDRRAGQCLCRGRQAAGVRHGRHRHDRRPVGSAGRGRRRQRSGLDRRRPAGAGRARRRRAVDPDHRRCRLRRRRRGGGRAAAAGAAARRDGARASWRDFGAIIIVERFRRGRAAGRPHRRRACRARARRCRGLPRRASAMPARSSSAATRRK